MESKFFTEIEKKISVKTLKDFEKEIRVKVNTELETLRKKDENLSRILMVDEVNKWNMIKNEDYSWLKLDSEKTKKLFRLIEIYSYFNDVIDSVKYLNDKVEKLKLLKEAPDPN